MERKFDENGQWMSIWAENEWSNLEVNWIMLGMRIDQCKFAVKVKMRVISKH